MPSTTRPVVLPAGAPAAPPSRSHRRSEVAVALLFLLATAAIKPLARGFRR